MGARIRIVGVDIVASSCMISLALSPWQSPLLCPRTDSLPAGGKRPTGPARPTAVGSAAALAEEERWIRRHAHDFLADNERFNLEQAFSLQLARVDAEWSTYEHQMKSEFEGQRAALEGKRHQPAAQMIAPGRPWRCLLRTCSRALTLRPPDPSLLAQVLCRAHGKTKRSSHAWFVQRHTISLPRQGSFLIPTLAAPA